MYGLQKSHTTRTVIGIASVIALVILFEFKPFQLIADKLKISNFLNFTGKISYEIYLIEAKFLWIATIGVFNIKLFSIILYFISVYILALLLNFGLKKISKT